MRTDFIAALIGVLLFSVPAVAGTITLTDGKVGWQSTQCTKPTAAESLLVTDRHAYAEDMNVRMTKYNQYSDQMQAYMNCVSNEAQTDASIASQAIAKAGQGVIEETNASLDKLGQPLKPK